MKRKNMMKNYKDTYQNTLIASGKKNLSMKVSLALTCLSILSVQGVIYTHYKNKQLKGKYEKRKNILV
jgi:cell division protein FtsL